MTQRGLGIYYKLGLLRSLSTTSRSSEQQFYHINNIGDQIRTGRYRKQHSSSGKQRLRSRSRRQNSAPAMAVALYARGNRKQSIARGSCTGVDNAIPQTKSLGQSLVHIRKFQKYRASAALQERSTINLPQSKLFRSEESPVEAKRHEND